uniref:Histone-lysine N-methyltransferase SETMAR n=1 Tax=Heterorhabditis bacteriophora TaxID=37862 RepID=A0A1I7WYW1_HETBA
MHQKLQRLWPTLVNRKRSILLDDNPRYYTSQKTLQKLNELVYETLSYPVYSPDLSLIDYHFFNHINNFLQKVFNNQVTAQTDFEEFIGSRTPEFYATEMNKLASCWQKCVDPNDSYFY